MKIYTRGGDDGFTSRLGGNRISKSDPLFQALGDLDELNAALGLAALTVRDNSMIQHRQGELLRLGAELAAQAEDTRFRWVQISHSTATLEQEIDVWDSDLEPLTNFIVPGGSEAAARLHLARAICRRAERSLITLDPPPRSEVIQWINRFSDWLFTLARHENAIQNVPDVKWEYR